MCTRGLRFLEMNFCPELLFEAIPSLPGSNSLDHRICDRRRSATPKSWIGASLRCVKHLGRCGRRGSDAGQTLLRAPFPTASGFEICDPTRICLLKYRICVTHLSRRSEDAGRGAAAEENELKSKNVRVLRGVGKFFTPIGCNPLKSPDSKK